MKALRRIFEYVEWFLAAFIAVFLPLLLLTNFIQSSVLQAAVVLSISVPLSLAIAFVVTRDR
jgi:hypothetical protein